MTYRALPHLNLRFISNPTANYLPVRHKNRPPSLNHIPRGQVKCSYYSTPAKTTVTALPIYSIPKRKAKSLVWVRICYANKLQKFSPRCFTRRICPNGKKKSRLLHYRLCSFQLLGSASRLHVVPKHILFCKILYATLATRVRR